MLGRIDEKREEKKMASKIIEFRRVDFLAFLQFHFQLGLENLVYIHALYVLS